MAKTDYRPLVSIWCITFNQEKYIRQCLEGFVIQKTSFRYEAVVHDDASTDGTATIIREYAEKYPDIITPILETENLWSRHDGSLERIMMSACKGEYIAFCEGDDYWTATDKLQKQAEYLELNHDCGLVYGSVEIVNKDNKILKKRFGGTSESFCELLNTSSIPTPTVLLRRNVMERYLEDIKPNERNWLMGDYPMWLYFAHESKIKYFPEIIGCYRELEESASHSKSFDNKDAFIHSLFEMKEFFCHYFNYDYFLHDHKFKSLAMNAFVFGRRIKTEEYLKLIKNKGYAVKILEFLSQRKVLFNMVSRLYCWLERK